MSSSRLLFLPVLAVAALVTVFSVPGGGRASAERVEGLDDAASGFLPADDIDGVRNAVERYFEGSATGRPEVMETAFHADARLIFLRDGEVVVLPLQDWLGRFTGSPAADEAQRARRVVAIDVSGDAAIAKLELDYPDVTLVDYMTLLRVGDEWRIVHKSFHGQPKSGQ